MIEIKFEIDRNSIRLNPNYNKHGVINYIGKSECTLSVTDEYGNKAVYTQDYDSYSDYTLSHCEKDVFPLNVNSSRINANWKVILNFHRNVNRLYGLFPQKYLVDYLPVKVRCEACDHVFDPEINLDLNDSLVPCLTCSNCDHLMFAKINYENIDDIKDIEKILQPTKDDYISKESDELTLKSYNNLINQRNKNLGI